MDYPNKSQGNKIKKFRILMMALIYIGGIASLFLIIYNQLRYQVFFFFVTSLYVTISVTMSGLWFIRSISKYFKGKYI